MKLLYVNGCLHEPSRTARLAAALLEELKNGGMYTVEEVKLNEICLLPLDGASLEARQKLLDGGMREDGMFRFARQFAAADLIVIAAPFWDMGIPAKLKTYLEHVSVNTFTFGVDEKGDYHGLCRAEELVYLTTRGMDIPDGDPSEQASPYLAALCRFFGIGKMESVSAFGLDMVSPEEAETRICGAISAAKDLARALASSQGEGRE